MPRVTPAAGASRSPCGVIPAPSGTAPRRPGASRAFVEKRLVAKTARVQNVHIKELESRIRNQLLRPELPPSSYDTAWVSMVPLRGSDQSPCFPQCVEWILQNQQDDGSWSLSQFDLSVSKDVLLSTLACVLALKRWNVGRENIWKGLHFIGRNFFVAMDEQRAAPEGFNITFPGILSLAIDMGLEFPIRQTDVDEMLHRRQMELQRHAMDNSYGRKAYMAYIAEGLGNLLDWDEAMKFQRKNGSLFNSPSTTAAALIHRYDDQALQYLNFLVNKFGSAVPAVYPLNIHCQLSMVDAVEKMGISHYFISEIKSILDMTYSCWLKKDEELMMDIATCAMAFRILRMNGYDVSSDELSHVSEITAFSKSLQGYISDTKSVLELYKASNVRLSENDFILDRINSWSGNLLKDKCSNGVHRTPIFREMEYALKFPFFATMERLEHKRNIEHFDALGSFMLKTECSPFHANQDLFLSLAVEDFSFSQSVYQDELRHLDSWVKENKLDQLQFARQKLTYCYLSAAATIFSPEMSDARMSWAKNGVLTTIVDDFFDVGGSKEELENLIILVERWHEHHRYDFYSEKVKIVFSAIYTTTNQLGVMASAAQGRDVVKHLAEIWLDLLRSMMIEAEWQRSQYVPTVEEYMENAVVSFALGPIVLPALYFVGQELLEHAVKDEEYSKLFRLMSTCGRLLNDTHGFEREGSEGKLNSVSLLLLHSGDAMSIEAVKKVIQKSIDTSRRDLLRLVLTKESAVPRPCKELFWKMCKILNLFYFQTDGFSSPKEMVSAVNAVINEPLKVQTSSPFLPSSSRNQRLRAM
ncbi:hypothetical protein U9M48_033761 [Paspalum notatum var. saurae]|uniref:Ent-kaurene synthase n=1 Tax=Paspalum notatum var. saurae TaxID=547442 RepID=A0AAQ3X6I8_PASNO